MRDGLKRVKAEKNRLEEALAEHGIDTSVSEGGGVVASGPRASWLREGLTGLGFEVKAEGKKKPSVRISAPADDAELERAVRAVRAVLKPDAVLLDVDGVLVDVSRSYRRAIVDTAAYFGATVTTDQISALKARGNANDDWALTFKLLEDQGIKVKQKEVTTEFERRYQGGLWRHETLRFKPDELRSLADRYPLALVTGRPRKDLYRLLEYHGLLPLFQAVVVREDGPAKPDPWPVKEALARLDVTSAWMLGDTVDDILAARGADVVPLGITAVGEGEEAVDALRSAGAARVLGGPEDLLALLP